MRVNTTFTNPEFEGYYQIAIMEAKEGKSKNDVPFIEFAYCILDAADASHIGYKVPFQKFYFSPKATPRTVKFLETLLEQKIPQLEEAELDPIIFIDGRATVQLVQELYTNAKGEEKQTTKTKNFATAEKFAQLARQLSYR